MVNILVIEDDKDLNYIICKHLNTNGFQATGCYSARDAYDLIYANHYNFIISDIMMKDINGFELVEQIRSTDKTVPILLITAREDYYAKEQGYRLGIDDYMVKPVDLNELILRVNALIRRANISKQKKIEVGNLILNEEEISAYVDGENIPITLREFQILHKLLTYPNRAFTRSQLLDEFIGLEKETGLRSVDVYITTLRSKFADCDGFQIKTVYGMGYKAVLL